MVCKHTKIRTKMGGRNWLLPANLNKDENGCSKHTKIRTKVDRKVGGRKMWLASILK